MPSSCSHPGLSVSFFTRLSLLAAAALCAAAPRVLSLAPCEPPAASSPRPPRRSQHSDDPGTGPAAAAAQGPTAPRSRRWSRTPAESEAGDGRGRCTRARVRMRAALPLPSGSGSGPPQPGGVSCASGFVCLPSPWPQGAESQPGLQRGEPAPSPLWDLGALPRLQACRSPRRHSPAVPTYMGGETRPRGTSELRAPLTLRAGRPTEAGSGQPPRPHSCQVPRARPHSPAGRPWSTHSR